ncbi:MAG: hypothetical protein V4514_17770 [Pseudomonadota bacterium]
MARAILDGHVGHGRVGKTALAHHQHRADRADDHDADQHRRDGGLPAAPVASGRDGFEASVDLLQPKVFGGRRHRLQPTSGTVNRRLISTA